jgi:hypothetical protein
MKSKSKKIYRKIYEEHYQCCLLPYIEIHHIDGNHKNNSIENLVPVTALEHYEIHKSQGDKAAAALIGIRAGISKEERARLNREQAIRNNAAGISGFKLGHASQAGKIGGKKGGKYAKENRTGIFALSPEKDKERHSNSVLSRLVNNGKACIWPKADYETV